MRASQRQEERHVGNRAGCNINRSNRLEVCLPVTQGCLRSMGASETSNRLSKRREEVGNGETGRKSRKHGRKLVVGMKLTTECREMLTWTIVKLAHPGDHVLAVHVAALPTQSGASIEEQEKCKHQLTSTLHAVLCVYESLCNLKQIKLQLEIVNGTNVRKALVEVARTREASKLVLGRNKYQPVGLTTSLGKHCMKQLPSTCTVVIVEDGKVIFDKKGTQTEVSGQDVLKAIRWSMRSFGGCQMIGGGFPDDEGSTVSSSPTPSERPQSRKPTLRKNGGECDRISDLDSTSSSGSTLHEESLNSPISVLPSPKQDITLEAFRFSFSKWRAEGTLKRTSSMRAGSESQSRGFSVLRNASEKDSLKSAELDLFKTGTSSLVGDLPRDDLQNSLRGSEEDVQPGWPLMHRSIRLDQKPVSQSLDRSLSVVNWALQLPQRPRVSPLDMPTDHVNSHRTRSLGEISNGVFRTHGSIEEEASLCQFQMSPSDDETYASKVFFSFDTPDGRAHIKKSTGANGLLSLAQQLNRLSLDRAFTCFSYKELEAATSSFSPGNLVGIGGGSQVYRGQLRDGKLLAVKCLNQGGIQAEEELLTDVEINSSLKHRHIVALLGYCVDTTFPILVYNFLSQGNLDNHLHGGKDGPVLEWAVRHKVAVGIAQALNYLHDGCPHPIIHRDVKASNILLSANFEPQLSDFGLAKWAPIDAPHIRCNDVVGTFGYLAPEYFMYGRVNDKTDVYSFGVVLLELITGRQPIDTSRPKGEENLVTWARPLLEKSSMTKLVDPHLGATYDIKQMQNMILAAALCVRQSAHCRPHMNWVWNILCGEGEILGGKVRHERTMSMELEEAGCNLEGTANYGDTNIQTHFAVAMLGVEDDVASLSSVELPHSSKYFEEYLEGRFSRSASFD